jgi:aryl-alcohol dehydrogenase-like predicted oxidoreductase
MVQAALRFILSHPAVSSVIPGAKNIRQLEENISASEEKMPHDKVQRLVEIWEQNLRESNLPW